jgi:hypothetical protein
MLFENEGIQLEGHWHVGATSWRLGGRFAMKPSDVILSQRYLNSFQTVSVH